MRTYVLMCGVLGIVSLGFLMLSALALFDISRGEPDVANEWRAVRIAVFPILLFHVAAVVGLFKAVRRIRE